MLRIPISLTHYHNSERSVSSKFFLAEFSSQLPHDGGAFYSNECVEGVRPYYRSAWPPMLYAAALWLSSGGFNKAGEIESEESDTNSTATAVVPNTATATTKSPEALNTDRFYLLLGI